MRTLILTVPNDNADAVLDTIAQYQSVTDVTRINGSDQVYATVRFSTKKSEEFYRARMTQLHPGVACIASGHSDLLKVGGVLKPQPALSS